MSILDIWWDSSLSVSARLTLASRAPLDTGIHALVAGWLAVHPCLAALLIEFNQCPMTRA